MGLGATLFIEVLQYISKIWIWKLYSVGKFDIELPKEATFKENGDGNYSVSLNMVKSKDIYLDGELSCTIGKINVLFLWC